MKRRLIVSLAASALALTAPIAALGQERDEWWETSQQETGWDQDPALWGEDWDRDRDWGEDWTPGRESEDRYRRTEDRGSQQDWWDDDATRWGEDRSMRGEDVRREQQRQDQRMRGTDWRDDMRRDQQTEQQRQDFRDQQRYQQRWDDEQRYGEPGRSDREFDMNIREEEHEDFNEWYDEGQFESQ